MEGRQPFPAELSKKARLGGEGRAPQRSVAEISLPSTRYPAMSEEIAFQVTSPIGPELVDFESRNTKSFKCPLCAGAILPPREAILSEIQVRPLPSFHDPHRLLSITHQMQPKVTPIWLKCPSCRSPCRPRLPSAQMLTTLANHFNGSGK